MYIDDVTNNVKIGAYSTNVYNSLTLDYGNSNLGINNISPGYTLDVAGDINFTGNLRSNGTIFSGGSGPVLT